MFVGMLDCKINILIMIELFDYVFGNISPKQQKQFNEQSLKNIKKSNG